MVAPTPGTMAGATEISVRAWAAGSTTPLRARLIAGAGRHARDAHAGSADGVVHRYPAEHDLDRRHRAGDNVSVQPGHRAEEVEAGDLAGGGVVVRHEAAATDAGQHTFRHAAREDGRDRGVGGRTAGVEDPQAHLGGGRVAGGDTGRHATALLSRW